MVTLALLSHFYAVPPATAGVFGSNSQTVGLEAAPVGASGTPAVGGADITIVGGSALLADAGPLGTTADLDDTSAGDQISIYVVRPDDTLGGIAQMFDVSVNTILWANNLSRGQAIKEGDTLVILPITGLRHTVARGETIESIATKYKGDAQEIIQFNDLESDQTLAVGDIIMIPDGEEAAVATKRPAPKNPVRGSRGPSFVGYYQRPIAGGVKTQGLHGYNGVDLAGKLGAPIVAAAGGQVIISKTGGWNGGYGNYIVVAHPNGTQTLYAHNTSNEVVVGQGVEQGQVIGAIGSTGRSTGPHVHFEVRGAKNPF